MKSYRTLALKELLSQKVTSILILIAVVLSTMMTTIVGQSIGVLSAILRMEMLNRVPSWVIHRRLPVAASSAIIHKGRCMVI